MSMTDDYADSGRYSKADQQRRLAQLLAAQGASTEPIASGWQGAAKLAQALAGVMGNRMADKRDAAQQAQQAQDLALVLAAAGAGAGGGTADAPGTEAADAPGTEPVSSAPTSDVEAYIRQSASTRGIDPNVAVRVARSEGLAPGVWQSNVRRNGRRETSYGPYQLLVGGGLGDKFIRQTGLNPRDPSTVKAQVDFALDQARQGGWSPWYGAGKVGVGNWTGIRRGGGGETAATPGVVPVSAAPSPDVAAFLGQDTGTRPTIPGGPAEMMTPAPIGRGAVAQPVPGTPMPTRPTVTGYPNIPGAPGPALPSNDPMVQPSAVSPPDALGRTTPGATGAPYAMPQPIPQGGHVLMAQQPPAPLPQAGRGLALLDPSAVPSSIDAPPAQQPVPGTPSSPIDARIAQAAIAGTPTATDLGAPRGTAVPELPRARPVAPLPSMPPGQLLTAPIQPAAAPVARTPVPRPAPAVASPAVPSPAGPATTAAVPQQRGQIFREPYPSVLSAQEFARQGQNYLTGRPSFRDQQRVAPRTMRGGLPAGAPVAAGPVSPRQGLIQRLFGGGAGGAGGAAQAAPAGSAVAGAAQPGGGDPRYAAMARLVMAGKLPASVLSTFLPKQPEPYTLSPGQVRYGPGGQELASVPAAPEKPERPPSAVQEYEYAKAQGFKGSFEDWELQQKRAGAQKNVGAPPPGFTIKYDADGNPVSMDPIPGSPAATAATEAAAKQAGSEAQQAKTGSIVVQDIDRVISQVENSPLWTTGFGGKIFKDVGGAPANDVRALVDTIKANVGFDQLQAMRKASPTGGALGPVSDVENNLLQSVLGSLDQSQNEDQFKKNLIRVKQTFIAVVDKIPMVNDDEDLAALQPGTLYVGADGVRYRKK